MVKIFLMTKNEPEMIEDWLIYHGYLFGLENIHILDASDDQHVIGIYEKYQAWGLNVHFSACGLDQIESELTKLMSYYRGENSFLIKLDTDEFLAYTRGLGGKILSLAGKTLNSLSCPPQIKSSIIDTALKLSKIDNFNFEKFWRSLPVTGQRYKASVVSWSIPSNEHQNRPCRDLTLFSPPHITTLKTYFHSDSFVSVDLGSHAGVSTNPDPPIDTALTIIHYHSTSVTESVRRAKQALVSHEYIAMSDSLSEQREKLEAVRARGEIPSFHKIDLYLQFIDSETCGKSLCTSILNQQHPYFRNTGKPMRLTLVRDTLHSIDYDKAFSL